MERIDISVSPLCPPFKSGSLSKCNQRQRQRLGDLALEDVNNKLVLAQGICHLSLW